MNVKFKISGTIYVENIDIKAAAKDIAKNLEEILSDDTGGTCELEVTDLEYSETWQTFQKKGITKWFDFWSGFFASSIMWFQDGITLMEQMEMTLHF